MVDVSLLCPIVRWNWDKQPHPEQLNCAKRKQKQTYEKIKPPFHWMFLLNASSFFLHKAATYRLVQYLSVQSYLFIFENKVTVESFSNK